MRVRENKLCCQIDLPFISHIRDGFLPCNSVGVILFASHIDGGMSALY